jgi:CRP/FNR family cyclic AMP-dependent transcriptional regulator
MSTEAPLHTPRPPTPSRSTADADETCCPATMRDPRAGAASGRGADADADAAAIQRALARVPWLRDCAPATRTILLRGARLRRFGPGETAGRRGEPADGLLLVVTGRLEMSSPTASGRRFVMSYAGPGHAVGLVPLLDGRGTIHDSVAQEDTEVLCIAAEDFHAAIDADPALCRRVMARLASRNRRLHASLADSTVMPLPVRLPRALLSLRRACGQTARSGTEVWLRLSQEGLAAMLGVPRQRVNAELRALARDGVLRMGYLRIELIDLPALRARAEEPSD